MRNPTLMGLGATEAGVLAWLFVLSERFNFVGEIIPRLVDCNEINKGIMKFSYPAVGTARRTRLSVPLTKGQAGFRGYLVGYSTISSDCRGKPFTSPDGDYVAKAIVRLEGSVNVRTYEAKLINNRSELVITDKIKFHRSDIANQVNEPTGDSVAAHLYNMSKNELEVYRDVAEGLFVANKSQIPVDTCETAQTVWSSSNVTLHRAINPQTPDIVEVSKITNSEHLSILIKQPTKVCGRKVFQTAIPELVVLFLSSHDSPLPNHPVIQNELDQWIYIKSLVMSSTTATELSLDHGFNQIAYQICEANRQLLISRLKDIRSESESLFFDTLGHPTLPVQSGEIVYLFHCQKVYGRLRTASKICAQELLHNRFRSS